MKKIWTLVGIVVLFVIITIILFQINPPDAYSNVDVTNFEECVRAGFPVMESYPRQCRSNGITFVEKTGDLWRVDAIILMQHESEGYLGCFGCNNVLCIDPSSAMREIEETESVHCGNEFEVLRKE